MGFFKWKSVRTAIPPARREKELKNDTLFLPSLRIEKYDIDIP